MSDLEARVERLEDEVGVDPLPTFAGYEMVAEVDHDVMGVNIYTGEEGYWWFENTTDYDAFCTGIRHDEFTAVIKEDNS